MKKQLKYLLVIIALIFIAFQFSPNRVCFRNSNVGEGFLRENNAEVEFICFGSIYNLSLRPCTVVLDIASKKDVDEGFLANENLTVTSIDIREGNATILDSYVIYVPPLSESRLQITCVGEYGGTGNGVRHPPSSIKVKMNK